MKLKSLLLGSAAALVGTTAHSADAIVVAGPEPVEYVRVCDAYGTGFFYIPGTETCLRIGGEIRFQLGATNDHGLSYSYDHDPDDEPELVWVGDDSPNFHGYTQGGWNTTTRARIYFDVRSETEWGTLQAYFRSQFDRTSGVWGTGDAANANHAWLSLGGLRMGWSDSAFESTPNSGAATFASHSDSSLRYGRGAVNFIQYNFSGSNGVFATLSFEDDDASSWNLTDVAPHTDVVHDAANYIPDVVFRAGVNQGWGAVWGAVAWDEDRTNDDTANYDHHSPVVSQVGSSGWAAVIGTQINVPNAPGSSLRLLGFYADSDNAYNANGGEWSFVASYGHQFSPEFFASVAAQYTHGLYLPGTDIETDWNRWDAELFATWTPVENFQVMGEVVYTKETDLNGSWSGFLRFSRFF